MTSDWNLVKSIPIERVIVQSHRGAGVLAAENTTAAFEMGWKLKTYPEGDIRATTDGVIVTFHDADFKRVVRDVPDELATKGVADITWEQLQKLEVGEWKDGSFVGHQVPRLSDVLLLMRERPERHLYLDIKNVQLPQLAELVRSHRVEKQVVLASPKHEIIREWKELIPQSDTLLWMRGNEAEIEMQFEALREAKFAGITQVQIHIHMDMETTGIKRSSMNPFKLGDEFLIRIGNELRSRSILFQTLPYGGATPDIYWKLLDLGVMSFATDHPEVTMPAIEQYFKMKRDEQQ